MTTVLEADVRFEKVGSDPIALRWRLLAMAVVVIASIFSLRASSTNLDGIRYFWLDDDQMISMRYARNLAEGHGLVWNPGERVEGYTNFMWTLVMSGVHVLPISDAKTSVVVRFVNCVLACIVVWLSELLLLHFRPRSRLALPLLLLSLAGCHDLLFWSAHGFETTLLTVVFMTVVLRLLHEARTRRPRFATYLLLGTLPLIRSDCHHAWLAAAAIALGTAEGKPAALKLLAIAAIPPVAHFAFRHGYYGALLPNTYDLKVRGIDLAVRLRAGSLYLTDVAARYVVALPLAVYGALRAKDRHRWFLLAGFGWTAAYTLWVGGDLFLGSRFVAHFVPVLLVLACLALDELAQSSVRRAYTLGSTLAASIAGYSAILIAFGFPSVLADENGDPARSLASAIAIARNTPEDARVAVHAAGIVPYFSRRYAVDWLGKTDRYVARLPPHDDRIGHNRYDPDYSLGRGVDVVVMTWLPAGLAGCTDHDVEVARTGSPPWVRAMYESPTFRREFCANAIEFPSMPPIYVRSSSSAWRDHHAWHAPLVSD